MIETRLLSTAVHGRYLMRAGSAGLTLIGFHGYAETADVHLADLERIPGASLWTLVAVQALHPFYLRSSGEVVASWMTRLDREHAVADNVAWVRRVVESLPPASTLVFAGFSQGAAMAWRAAAAIRCDGVITLGGDIPPDVTSSAELPPALIGRGSSDEWYTGEKFRKDLSFLGAAFPVQSCVFDGGHEWSDPFRDAAAAFLRGLPRV